MVSWIYGESDVIQPCRPVHRNSKVSLPDIKNAIMRYSGSGNHASASFAVAAAVVYLAAAAVYLQGHLSWEAVDVVHAAPLLLFSSVNAAERLQGPAVKRLSAGSAAFVGAAALILPSTASNLSLAAAAAVVLGGEGLGWFRRPGADDTASYTVSYVVGGSVAAAAVAAASPDFGAVALAAVTAVYVAATLRSLDVHVFWLVAAAAAAAAVASTAPVTPSPVEVGGAAAFTLALAAATYYADVMTVDGSLAGGFLSFVLLVTGGVEWFLVLAAFVALGTICTRYRSKEKTELGYGHHAPRGFGNVAANGGVAFAAAVAYAFIVGWDVGGAMPLTAAFAASLATASADTASSEVGVVHGEPRLITSLEPVEPGVDGGVSPQGEVIAFAAASVIAGLGFIVGLYGAVGLGAVTVAGFLGCNVDSLLGATLEERLLSNESVNLLSCVSGAIAAVLLLSVI